VAAPETASSRIRRASWAALLSLRERDLLVGALQLGQQLARLDPRAEIGQDGFDRARRPGGHHRVVLDVELGRQREGRLDRGRVHGEQCEPRHRRLGPRG
jgi:hypothetical protein